MMIRKVILYIYIIGLILLVVLPLNDAKTSFLSDTYVVKIRLDYLSHVILFLPFILLLKLAYPTKGFYWIILAGIVFAGFSEGLQYLLPYRSFNINDLIANTIGVIVGIIFLLPGVYRVVERRADG